MFSPETRRNPGFLEPLQNSPESNLGKLAAPVKPPTANAEGYIRLVRPLSLSAPAVVLPEGVVIAPLAADDAARVHALLQWAYADGFGSVPDRALDWWNSVTRDSEFDRNLAFVAKSGVEVVGFCLCWTSSFVKDLVVSPLWRNRGIGSGLLSSAITALRARGAEELALKVNIYNGTAQRLYRHFGFAQD
jgi:GNAT superfamily N-acetyltransferase